MKKKITSYNAVITQHDGEYELVFPDFKDVLAITNNVDLDQLLLDATDVLFLALDGEAEPERTDFKTLQSRYPNSMIQRVVVDMQEKRNKAMYYDMQKEKVNITLPRYLKEFAKKRGINISQLTTQELKKEFNKQ